MLNKNGDLYYVSDLKNTLDAFNQCKVVPFY